MRRRSPAGLLLPALLLAAGCGESDSEDGADTNPWENQTYLLEVPPANWSEPPQVGSEIGAFVPSFLIQIGRFSDDTYEVTLGTADESGAQDLCNPTTRVATVTADYPAIQIGPADVLLHLEYVSENDPADNVTVYATARQFMLTNVLPERDAPAEAGELTAVADARELYPLFHLLPNPDPDTVCTALESFGAACAACPQDGEAYCLQLKAVRLGANEVDAGALQPVDADSLDPSCSE